MRSTGGVASRSYDPQHRVTGDFSDVLTSDLNIVHGVATVQGYSSAVNGRYDAATGTHTRNLIYPSAVSGDIADQLDLRLLLVPPSYVGSSSAAPATDQGVADVELEAALAPPHWVPAGTSGPYLAFANTRALGRAWIVPATAGSPGDPSVVGSEVTRVTTGAGDDEKDTIRSPTRALLVRSVAYSAGWSARVQTSTGSSKRISARRLGLVQAVMVPAGTSSVTWSYDPPGLKVGLWLTVLAAAGLFLAGLALAARWPARSPIDSSEGDDVTTDGAGAGSVLVTGGAGFIGTALRPRPAGWRRPGDRRRRSPVS